MKTSSITLLNWNNNGMKMYILTSKVAKLMEKAEAEGHSFTVEGTVEKAFQARALGYDNFPAWLQNEYINK